VYTKLTHDGKVTTERILIKFVGRS